MHIIDLDPKKSEIIQLAALPMGDSGAGLPSFNGLLKHYKVHVRTIYTALIGSFCRDRRSQRAHPGWMGWRWTMQNNVIFTIFQLLNHVALLHRSWRMTRAAETWSAVEKSWTPMRMLAQFSSSFSSGFRPMFFMIVTILNINVADDDAGYHRWWSYYSWCAAMMENHDVVLVAHNGNKVKPTDQAIKMMQMMENELITWAKETYLQIRAKETYLQIRAPL